MSVTRRGASNEIVLRPLRPNVGIEIAYRARLQALVEEMTRSVEYWLRAAYRKNEPTIARDERPTDRDQPLTDAETDRLLLIAEGRTPTARDRRRIDELHARGLIRLKPGRVSEFELTDIGHAVVESLRTPAADLGQVVSNLAARWQRQFDEAAPELAAYFATAVGDRTSAGLRAILKKGGISVRFTMSPAQRDIVDATIAQNVALIKSIPAQYLTSVQGLVMRSVQTGRDLGQLTKDLQEQFGVTRRRAAFIARSQNNLATAAMTRARQAEIGITEAIWVHSGGGKEPRPTHLKAGRERERYDVNKGWFDPAVGEFIYPGQLPNCRCVSRSVVKGFS